MHFYLLPFGALVLCSKVTNIVEYINKQKTLNMEKC